LRLCKNQYLHLELINNYIKPQALEMKSCLYSARYFYGVFTKGGLKKLITKLEKYYEIHKPKGEQNGNYKK
jgi:hypothetical protein